MDSFMKWFGYLASLAILIFGFFLFYWETNEWIGSLLAASLSAALAFGAFIVMRWFIDVFVKK
jgi:hypothetical protein